MTRAFHTHLHVAAVRREGVPLNPQLTGTGELRFRCSLSPDACLARRISTYMYLAFDFQGLQALKAEDVIWGYLRRARI